MSNGAARMEYPPPLGGEKEEQIRQIRTYLFGLADEINRILSKLEDLERAMEAMEDATTV